MYILVEFKMTSQHEYKKIKTEVNKLCKSISENDMKQGILGKCSGIDKIIHYFENAKSDIVFWSNRDVLFIKILYKFYKFSTSIESKLIDYMCKVQVPTPYNTIFITHAEIQSYEQIMYIVSKTQKKISEMKYGTLLPMINEVYINHVKILHYICEMLPTDIAHHVICFAYHNDVFECKMPGS